MENRNLKRSSTAPKKLSKSLSKNLRMAAQFVIAVSFISACQKAEWREIQNPNTGDAAAETQTGNLGQAALQPGQSVYVAPDRLRGRQTPDQDPEQSSTLFEQGDRVEVVDPEPRGDDRLVGVRIIEPTPIEREPDAPVSAPAPSQVQAAPTTPAVAYVPQQYLNSAPIEATPVKREADRFIVIQNIATEKLRVYELSKSPSAPNKLILETDMIAGENNPTQTRRTALGSYKILSWHKFYQDNQNLFPSWYDASYPTLPLPGASLADWSQKHFLPQSKIGNAGVMRGAFGWYTAKLGPNAFAQWTHGTLGWGADGDRFIQIPKTQLAQYYSDPRSFGCTRVENQAIAFLQDLLPVGTRVVKIYARESETKIKAPLSDLTSWEWVLTKEGVRSSNPESSARAAVTLRDVPAEEVLETGVYRINTIPKAVAFKKTVKGERLSATIIRPEANLYDLKETSFQGEFLVNEGRLLNYAHPKALRKGGYTDELLPRAIVK